jgi:hypothetical protein
MRDESALSAHSDPTAVYRADRTLRPTTRYAIAYRLRGTLRLFLALESTRCASNTHPYNPRIAYRMYVVL